MKDMREKLPTIYIGHRRTGKTHQLLKKFKESIDAQEDAYIVAQGGYAKSLKGSNPEYKSMIIWQLNHIRKKKAKAKGKIIWYVDEWDLLKTSIKIELIQYSWQGDTVIGFTTPLVENVNYLEYDSHFDTNPHLTIEEINEDLKMSLG